MSKPKLEIVDTVEGKTLAYRNKTCVEIFPRTQEVGFTDYSYSYEEIIAVGKKLEELLEKDLVDVTWITVYLPMISESDTEDIVIKSYVELYLKALNESKSYKFIKVIKSRMFELIKRKQLKNQTK